MRQDYGQHMVVIMGLLLILVSSGLQLGVFEKPRRTCSEQKWTENPPRPKFKERFYNPCRESWLWLSERCFSTGKNKAICANAAVEGLSLFWPCVKMHSFLHVAIF